MHMLVKHRSVGENHRPTHLLDGGLIVNRRCRTTWLKSKNVKFPYAARPKTYVVISIAYF
jgi:hypothetical protein